MPSWDPNQYLRFAEQRTRPCRELAARIQCKPVAKPVREIIDLGCGPGNSTRILADCWPDAELTGLDSSPEMISAARQAEPRHRWMVGDIGEWATRGADKFDVVFSNAALQWLPDHAVLYPRLLDRTAPGGALAVQMPGNHDGPSHRLMREIAKSPGWRRWFPSGQISEWHVHDLAFYYDVLAPHASGIDLWETVYIHVMPDAESIVEWYKGTGLRPYLDTIESDSDKKRFVAEYLEGIRAAYPARPDGSVLFPFNRLFLVAHRPD
ncbi:MAG TPA: trans-aconitate 2-methyltransferase [Blastocatellia bacterium]|nr:trans-aconitate 2-methyltransferase [Blastocatellia bacterium]